MGRAVARRKKHAIAIGLVALLTVAGAGAAFAYWTSSGTGSGTAKSGDSVAFTITTEEPVGTIAPGSAGQTVDFTVTNSGEGTQTLSTVTVALASPTGTPWVPTGECDVADYVATVTTAPTPGPIAAGGSVSGTATVTLTNTAENQDDCQGQDVPLYFVAS